MKKIKIIIASMLIFSSSILLAQEYKLKVSGSKTLRLIEVNKVEIKGYDGSEIIITTQSKSKGDEERAKGLTAINGLGITDNTGIGLSAIESGNSIEIQQLAKRNGNKYLIKVPKSVKVYYEHSGTGGSTFKVSNISSEIETSTLHNGIHLDNVTGPMTINSVHGKIEATFASVNQSSPISIISIHGLVDVSLPSNTKANLKMETHWGELLSDMNIEIDKTDDQLKAYSSKVNGKLNGGGVALHISSTHNNVYLRTKK
jgi:hypothetical protein